MEDYGIKIGEVMTRNPVTMGPNKTVYEGIKKMASKDVSSLPVIEKGELLGMLTYDSLNREVILEGKAPKEVQVSEVMEKDIITAESTQDLSKVVEIMNKYKETRVPICDGEELVGLITRKDLFKIHPHIIEFLEERTKIREPERKMKYRGDRSRGMCEECGGFSRKLREVKGRMLCSLCREEFKRGVK